ncbi:Uma2 family endonuclease [Botryobacter ruber]|uniref:Uma2 family endonuclease n=1 Tax=Botryobacter ruber TaxID=2171629 RepID=UPI00196A4151|nr:Uma2 family endonuclease [Botryobacter ruber]
MGLPKHEHLPHYTYDDYKVWEGHWELINGIPYAMTPAPSVYHQEINGNLYAELRQALHPCRHCKVLLPVDWRITEDTIVQPDLSVLCNSTDTGAFITQVPAVVFEILSPATANKDRTIKFELYESQGVEYYVIINPQQKTAEVFRLFEGRYKKVKETTTDAVAFSLTEAAGCNFTVDFSQIW